MVKTDSPVDYPSTLSSPPPVKRGRYSTNRSSLQQSSSEIDHPKSRRKCAPKKILDATLKTSSISPLDLTTKKEQNSNEENKTEETDDEKESSVLKVC
uniref:Uncharacterized protein n=1 Tax=Panagrolaimus sp. JU765 TaxID=591449 RepID=A0AC34QKX5_9BILA